LTAHFAPESVAEFVRANDERGALREGADGGLCALRDAIELLRVLASTLRG
jgi:hypothetical protein